MGHDGVLLPPNAIQSRYLMPGLGDDDLGLDTNSLSVPNARYFRTVGCHSREVRTHFKMNAVKQGSTLKEPSCIGDLLVALLIKCILITEFSFCQFLSSCQYLIKVNTIKKIESVLDVSLPKEGMTKRRRQSDVQQLKAKRQLMSGCGMAGLQRDNEY
ncbi:hypothetical protein RUM43_012844 [Polyplax serrata]|uniref:Uncharacterized protein n=1 Tax=Polyplax serrata TaxID=468196 RepID=A0AAN8P2I5_POLSC